MSRRSFLVCICVVWSATSSLSDDVESRTVVIGQGPVRGYKEPNGDIFAFHGIPYANIPTGADKFKAPLPPPVWTETFEAINGDIVCPQTPLGSRDMREDCLVANIFTPDTIETNLPVLVVVHGGAFQLGFGNQLIPRTLVKSEKIVAVTFNYRLGAHGFLCLGTKDIPGNAGMKDQVALLRWVKDNIRHFGGNPDDVTIAGCSAGGASVDLLTMSPLASGLFNKAITESGASIGAISVQVDPIGNAKIFAELLNFTDVNNIGAMEEFFKTASFDLLTSRMYEVTERENSAVLFTPCFEADTDEDIFLNDYPANIFVNGNYSKVPLFYGFAKFEGLLRIELFESWKDKMNENFSDFMPADLQFENEEEKSKIAEDVRQFYFGDQPVGEDTIVAYVDFFTDVLFAYPMLKALKMRVESNNDTIYLYEYNFVDENTPPVPLTNVRGANHCDQLMAVVRDEEDITDEYRDMKALMRELWLNFILTGNPVPEGSNITSWPAARADRSPHMLLSENMELKGSLLEERAAFWDDIYQRFYRAPVPPTVTDNAASYLKIPSIWMILAIVIYLLL